MGSGTGNAVLCTTNICWHAPEEGCPGSESSRHAPTTRVSHGHSGVVAEYKIAGLKRRSWCRPVTILVEPMPLNPHHFSDNSYDSDWWRSNCVRFCIHCLPPASLADPVDPFEDIDTEARKRAEWAWCSWCSRWLQVSNRNVCRGGACGCYHKNTDGAIDCTQVQ